MEEHVKEEEARSNQKVQSILFPGRPSLESNLTEGMEYSVYEPYN